ncbi:MAG: ferrous iron transport protein B [Bacteroidales bacterium]|nr:ferrous iron transport protein B [Bacteroidales bacterium]
MTCTLDCENCAFRELEKSSSGAHRVTVAVVGCAPEREILDFRDAPSITLKQGIWSVRFLNFTGEDLHIGRKILECKPDVVLNTVDSTNLSQSMHITTRLIDMDTKVVLALSRYGELLSTGHSVDYTTLGALLGFPVIAFDTRHKDLAAQYRSHLMAMIIDSFNSPADMKKHIHVPYGPDVDKAIAILSERISQCPGLASYHDRYLAVRLIEDPHYIYNIISTVPNAQEIIDLAARQRWSLMQNFSQEPIELIRNARYGFIHGALQETLHHSSDHSDHTLTERIDAVLTNRWLGLPLLLVILAVVFEATFKLGAYPQIWIENGIKALGILLSDALSSTPDWLSSLIVNGLVQGVGAVLAFLPNIIILFIFLSILEDSGYMARAAFLMDKIMHRFGLHGKSFIPMLIGFGCNVPAIMSARSIEDRKDRTLTMLMIPFMSCSARLPVYLLMVSAFFPDHKALVMIGIYLAGIVLSILFAFIMKRTPFFRKSDEDYVCELPAFRMPTLRNSGPHIWERVADYLQKITTVIVAASVIIWALEYFPSDRTLNGSDKEQSALAQIGRSMEKVTAPLGFDWKLNVCLLTGLPAKEAIVSTMGILYHTDSAPLAESMEKEGIGKGTALAFMLFVLLYFPCIATVNTISREAGRKWAVFTVVHSLILAWIVAFIVNLVF